MKMRQILSESDVRPGQIVRDHMRDRLKVIKITPSEILLKNDTGQISSFPKDFGSKLTIDDFWGYFKSR